MEDNKKPIDVIYTSNSTELSILSADDIKSGSELRDKFIEMYNRVVKLDSIINSTPPKLPTESESQLNLTKAFGQTILDCDIPLRNGKSQYGAVPDLDDYIKASKDALKKNKVALSFDECEDQDGNLILLTKIIHVETCEFKIYTDKVLPIDNKSGAYAKAGGYTYAKRKKLASLLNLGGD